MNSIESQFVGYEQAVNLKELGFNWDCLGYYGINEDNVSIDILNHCQWSNCGFSHEDTGVQTILYSQAFDWFRVEHNLEIQPIHIWDNTDDPDREIDYIKERPSGYILDMFIYGENYSGEKHTYPTYESARLACLEKLIELVTEKKG